jgi:predicted nuclease of predicted toxin-antitoxin system
MNIKLDENIPRRLARVLNELGHNAHTAPEEGLAGCSDQQIWAATQAESRFLITQDLDFSDLRHFSPGSHHGLLVIRLAWPTRQRLIERVKELFSQEAVEAWVGCFVVVTDHKVRVLRPTKEPDS